jgi:hypothetical protein
MGRYYAKINNIMKTKVTELNTKDKVMTPGTPPITMADRIAAAKRIRALLDQCLQIIKKYDVK